MFMRPGAPGLRSGENLDGQEMTENLSQLAPPGVGSSWARWKNQPQPQTRKQTRAN